MHDEDGGEAAESMAETRRVEAAAGCAAGSSVVSNPSIPENRDRANPSIPENRDRARTETAISPQVINWLT